MLKHIDYFTKTEIAAKLQIFQTLAEVLETVPRKPW